MSSNRNLHCYSYTVLYRHPKKRNANEEKLNRS